MPESEKFLLSITLSVVGGILLGLFSFLWLANCLTRPACSDLAELLPPSQNSPSRTIPATQLSEATPKATLISTPPTATRTIPISTPSTPTATHTPTPTASPTPTATPTVTPTASPSATPTATSTSTITPTPSATPLPTLAEIVAISAEMDWMIIAGGYPSLNSALRDAANFEGYQLVPLLQQGVWRSAIMGYASQNSADIAAAEIRDTIRSTVYVRQTSRWCPNMAVEDGYIRCGS